MNVDSGFLHPPRALFELRAAPIVLNPYKYAMWAEIRGDDGGLTAQDDYGCSDAFSTPPPTLALTRNFAHLIIYNMQHVIWWRAERAYRRRAWDHPTPQRRLGGGGSTVALEVVTVVFCCCRSQRVEGCLL